MGNRLESIKQNLVFNDQLVSSSINSSSVDVGGCEGPFSLQLIWINGVSPSMSAELQVSNDKQNWSVYSGSSAAITTASGNIMWDITTGSGCEYFRIAITVTSGSAEFYGKFNGRNRI